MDTRIGVLLTCPISAYLQTSLAQRFTLFKFYQIPPSSKASFLKSHSESIRAVVGNGVHGADAALIESLPKLEIIASHSSGLDQIDLIKCKEKGIKVTYVPGASAEEVADLAILLAIATLRSICVADRFVRNGLWKNGEFQLTSKFNGKSVGIVGLGRIGSAIARRIEAFNCSINYYSRSKKSDEQYVYYADVLDLASNSQILIISCALTDETHHIINREVLNALGPEGIVINVGRGGLIDQREMISGLLEGRLGGAGLDVIEDEPNVPEELIGLDKVVLSPHVGACTVETRLAMADLHVKVLMTCPMYPYLEQQLDQRFNLFRFWQFGSDSEKSDFFQQNSQSIRAVVGNTKLGADAELIDLLPNLEIVSTYSVGLDKIDLLKCKERGIKVTNTPDVLTDDVADIAIGLMLAVLRKIAVADAFLRNGMCKNGDFEPTTKFSGKSVGIIGLGRIGSAIAKRAEAFGCEISYHSRSRKPNTTYKYYTNTVDLATDSQILVVACSLTEETKQIVNKNVINALGPEGILINIGRGQHVAESELVSALVEGRLGGAGLDVYENEPNVLDEMLELKNVVLLSHVGSDTFETCNDMANLVIGNLEAHFMSRPLLTPEI